MWNLLNWILAGLVALFAAAPLAEPLTTTDRALVAHDVAALESRSPGEISPRPSRADCPRCKGSGKVKSGDGLSWVTCGECEPPTSAGEPGPAAEPPPSEAEPAPAAAGPMTEPAGAVPFDFVDRWEMALGDLADRVAELEAQQQRAPTMSPPGENSRPRLLITSEEWCIPCQQMKAAIKDGAFSGMDIEWRKPQGRQLIPTIEFTNAAGQRVSITGWSTAVRQRVEREAR